MELEAVEMALAIGNGGVGGILSLGGGNEAARELRELVAVAVPDIEDVG